MSEYNIQVIAVVIASFLGFIGGTLALIGTYIANKIGHMTNSMDALNVRVAVVIERLENQDKKIDNQDKRISKLEGNA